MSKNRAEMEHLIKTQLNYLYIIDKSICLMCRFSNLQSIKIQASVCSKYVKVNLIFDFSLGIGMS